MSAGPSSSSESKSSNLLNFSIGPIQERTVKETYLCILPILLVAFLSTTVLSLSLPCPPAPMLPMPKLGFLNPHPRERIAQPEFSPIHQVQSERHGTLLKKTTRTEADTELSGNEVGRQERGRAVDAAPEESGSDCLTVEGRVGVTLRPNRMFYHEGVSRSIRQTSFSRVWDRRPRDRWPPSRSPGRRSLAARKTAIGHERLNPLGVELSDRPTHPLLGSIKETNCV